MTDYFVDSNSVGVPDGLTKTTAWLTLAAATGSSPGAGDRILCSHLHSETSSSSQTFPFSGDVVQQVEVISIDYSDDTVLRGASIRLTGSADILITGDFCLYQEMTIVAADDIFINGVDRSPRFIRCIIGGTSSGTRIVLGNAAGVHAYFEDCEFEFSNVAGHMEISNSAHVEIIGGFLTNPATRFIDLPTGVRVVRAILRGMDLSNATTIIEVSTGGNPTDFVGNISACNRKAGGNLITGNFNSYRHARLVIDNSDEGTITTAAFKQEVSEAAGTSITTTARYRTGGANDLEQANEVSQEMTALASRTAKRLTSTFFDTGVYLDTSGTNKDFTVHCAHDGVGSGTAGALQTDEFWLEMLGPSEKATSDAQGFFQTERIDHDATPADLPLESGETWNGTSVGTKQSATTTYLNEIEGWYTMRIHLATGSGSDVVVNADPKIVVTEA